MPPVRRVVERTPVPRVPADVLRRETPVRVPTTRREVPEVPVRRTLLPRRELPPLMTEAGRPGTAAPREP